MMDRRSWLRAALATLGLASTASAAPATDLAADLEPLRHTYALPALAAAVVKTGVLAATGVTGVRAFGRPDKARIGDRFHLGSNTKAMTATLAGMLIEEGKLGWNSTIGEWLGGPAQGVNPEKISTGRL
jgi:CubicO group peptidase (beta-lactamase class C family)